MEELTPERLQHLGEIIHRFLPLIIIVSIWDSIWKLIAVWRAARANQLAWFICLGIFNTVGILPIIYILTHRKKDSTAKIVNEFTTL